MAIRKALVRRSGGTGSKAAWPSSPKSKGVPAASICCTAAQAEIAAVYRSCRAHTALSVVTSPWFGGNLRMLDEVAAADLGLPILRKDLISTERAVEASKRAGASAILLVLPLLGRDRLRAMLEVARELDVEPFVEVATREEIFELREVYPGVVAINNADIKTNEVEGDDISRSTSLIDRQDARLWARASRIHGAG